jgi:hypothetical protein
MDGEGKIARWSHRRELNPRPAVYKIPGHFEINEIEAYGVDSGASKPTPKWGRFSSVA